MKTPVPAEVFLHALEKYGPMAIEDFGIASRSHTIKMLQLLRADGLVHVCSWRIGERGRWRMVLGLGAKIDAPMPRLSRQETNRRAIEKRRAAKVAEYTRPSLPTHTPTIGIWGI